MHCLRWEERCHYIRLFSLSSVSSWACHRAASPPPSSLVSDFNPTPSPFDLHHLQFPQTSAMPHRTSKSPAAYSPDPGRILASSSSVSKAGSPAFGEQLTLHQHSIAPGFEERQNHYHISDCLWPAQSLWLTQFFSTCFFRPTASPRFVWTTRLPTTLPPSRVEPERTMATAQNTGAWGGDRRWLKDEGQGFACERFLMLVPVESRLGRSNE